MERQCPLFQANGRKLAIDGGCHVHNATRYITINADLVYDHDDVAYMLGEPFKVRWRDF